MRVFLSIELPDYVKETCLYIQHQLKESESFSGNFVPLQQLHITLIFFADISLEQLTAIQRALDTFEFKRFEIALGEVEIISDKLIWISVSNEYLDALYESLKPLFEETIFTEDQEKTLKAHITLVRIKKLDSATKLASCVRDLQYVKDSFMVDQVCLKLSQLSEEGPIHSIIESYQSRDELNVNANSDT